MPIAASESHYRDEEQEALRAHSLRWQREELQKKWHTQITAFVLFLIACVAIAFACADFVGSMEALWH